MVLPQEVKQKMLKRIEIIGKYYDLDTLVNDKTDQEAVAKYYRASDFFYNLIHSKGGGNIHMGLSDDGEFHKSDFLKQAQYISKYINSNTSKVLEIGAGKVVNSKYLAMRYPKVNFTALDLPHRNFLKNKVPKNISLIEGDFNDLSGLKRNSFDLVFGVETVCHGEDKERVVSEVVKVLKPGGKFIIFDVYEPKPQGKMSEFERYISTVTLAAMRVTANDQYIGDMKKYLKKHNFSQIEITDLTQEIVPSLTRLERISKYYYEHPLFLKTLKSIISHDATINSIAGWLMSLTFDGKNIHQYNRIVATKDGWG